MENNNKIETQKTENMIPSCNENVEYEGENDGHGHQQVSKFQVWVLAGRLPLRQEHGTGHQKTDPLFLILSMAASKALVQFSGPQFLIQKLG